MLNGRLTQKQERFCMEYVADLSKAGAARRAGISESGAKAMMREPLVCARINELMQERTERLKVTQDKVVRELAAIAFFDPAEALEYLAPEDGELTVEQGGRRISGVQVRPFSDYPGWLRKAIKSLSDKVNANGYVTRVIEFHDKVAALKLLLQHTGGLTEKVALEGKDGAPLTIKILRFSDAPIEEADQPAGAADDEDDYLA